MNIDETKIFGEKYFDENLALACLLATDVCFLNNCKYGDEYTTCIFVNANDIFVPAADAESITQSDGDPDSEIIQLYKYWKEDPIYGPIKWLSIKRNCQPRGTIIKEMKRRKMWDDKMKSLSVNKCW